MTVRLASRTRRLAPSAVREILKVTEQPEVLSFAGGLPAPELFPVEAIAEAHAWVLANEGRAALQYSTTEGHAPLREWVAHDLARKGVPATTESVIMTHGSQQGIDLVARVLLEPGAKVAVESPTYLAALQVFAGAEAELIPILSDDEGIDVGELGRVLAREPVRLIYLVPNFQNPKGTTLSTDRRHALMGLLERHQVPLLEDDPYGELRFRGQAPPPLAALDRGDWVVSLGTFSKTLAPGLRLGYLHAGAALRSQLVVAKQAVDLHCGSLTQRAVHRLLTQFDYPAHLRRLRATYALRCQTMLDALERELPAGTRCTRPEGGLFVWAELPFAVDTEQLLPAALAEKVAYVPGAPFFCRAPRRNTLRLNFSNREPALIDEGMRRLGQVLERFRSRGGEQRSSVADAAPAA